MSGFPRDHAQKHGYHVLCAADFDHALNLFKEHQTKSGWFSPISDFPSGRHRLMRKIEIAQAGPSLILASGYPTKNSGSASMLGRSFLSKPYNTPDILQR